MKIVERREHKGAWWGRARSGAWYRWNAARVGWEGPLTPPWTGTDAPQLIEAPAAPSPGAEIPPPRDRIDAWWDRTFPPFSRRRLLFGLVALPLIGGLQELLLGALGRDPSLPRYLFICLVGGVILSTAWLPGMRKYADVLRTPRHDPSAPSPEPMARSRFGKDFLVALPFCFAIVLIVQLTVSGADLSAGTLASQAVAAALAALMVALRSSIWGLILFSAVGGVLGGLAASLLSLMTFSDPSGDFVWGWILGAAILFAYGYPMWRCLRNMEARGFRLPMWIVMGCSVIMVAGASLMFLAER